MECEEEIGSQRGGKRKRGRSSRSSICSRSETWTLEEDNLLRNAVQNFQERNWKEIAKYVPGKTYMQCRNRWCHVIDPRIVKGKWTKEEDDMIIKMVNEFGPRKWCVKAQAIPGRTGKQCRDRWTCHLDPSIKKETWTNKEDMRLLIAYQPFGSSWCKIKKFLPGRTENAIKNRWHSNHMSEKLEMYKAKNLLGDPISLVPIPNSAKKYSETGTDTICNLTSETSINTICNSALADELTDIDMIICGSPFGDEMPSADDEDSTRISTQNDLNNDDNRAFLVRNKLGGLPYYVHLAALHLEATVTKEVGSQRGGKRKLGSSRSSICSRSETWTLEEDNLLRNAIQLFQERNWKEIAKYVPGKTCMQCRNRWCHVIDPRIVKGKWTKEEDDMIIKMVNEFGPRKWCVKAQAIPGRTGKQCRDRWTCHLDPSIKKEAWTRKEDMRLLQAYQLFGSSWCKIKKFLPGRTENAIKNRWHSNHMSEKLEMYKAKNLLGNPISLDPIPNSAKKYSETGTDSISNLTSETSINPICNLALADELTDIDMIVCGSPLGDEMPSEDDEDSTRISTQNDLNNNDNKAF